jgi:hypothetical protein
VHRGDDIYDKVLSDVNQTIHTGAASGADICDMRIEQHFIYDMWFKTNWVVNQVSHSLQCVRNPILQSMTYSMSITYSWQE